jgi:hypothetical protein
VFLRKIDICLSIATELTAVTVSSISFRSVSLHGAHN